MARLSFGCWNYDRTRVPACFRCCVISRVAQGFSKQVLTPEEIFAPETMEAFLI